MKKNAVQSTGCALVALGLGLTGCGATSIDERWDSDGEVTLPAYGMPPWSEQGQTFACAAAERAQLAPRHVYATPPAFWLGSQSAIPLRVDGPGFLVARVAPEAREERFSSELELFVGPDGTLEDELGGAVLGYQPIERAGGPCVGPLRAPVFAPPYATTSVRLSMNLDSRDNWITFDLLDPSGSANFSVSTSVFDSVGASHYLDIYFARDQQTVHYYVVMDGSDLEGGTPGYSHLVGQGSLLFTIDGYLEIATTPEVCVDFSGGAVPNQCLEIDFGPDIVNDGASVFQVTSFADTAAVHSLSVDGYGPGTGTHISVEPNGEVVVAFDNGNILYLGKLALARFAREAALQTGEGGRLYATPRSGPPQFGNPLGPGRGSLQLSTAPAGAPALDGSGLGL